jgi:RNA polymerase sigma factor (sigma-70 family)
VTLNTPDTRHSLLRRLPDRQDALAWDEFVTIYEPLVYRLARCKGLQHVDAQEVVQEVFVAISRAIDNWDPQGDGRFRDWLFRISRNLVINYLTRRKHRSLASGESGVAEMLAAVPARSEESAQWFALEERRQVFHYCARLLSQSVGGKQWQAFWLTAVQHRTVAEVAQELGMTAGAIYIARSRMMNRLRQEVNRLLSVHEEWSSLDLHHPSALPSTGSHSPGEI